MKVVQGSTAHKLSVGGDVMKPEDVKLAPEAERIISEIIAKALLRKHQKGAAA